MRDRLDRDFEAHRAKMRRMELTSMIIGWSGLILMVGVVAWCLTHPRTIGAFLGSIVAGFNGAAG